MKSKTRSLPTRKDWYELRDNLPNKEAKRICELGARQYENIQRILRQYKRGKKTLDPIIITDMDQVTERMVRNILSICQSKFGAKSDITSKIEKNLKKIRESLRDVYDDFTPEGDMAMVKYIRQHHSLLYGTVYRALDTTASEVRKSTKNKLADTLESNIGQEPEPKSKIERMQEGV